MKVHGYGIMSNCWESLRACTSIELVLINTNMFIQMFLCYVSWWWYLCTQLSKRFFIFTVMESNQNSNTSSTSTNIKSQLSPKVQVTSIFIFIRLKQFIG